MCTGYGDVHHLKSVIAKANIQNPLSSSYKYTELTRETINNFKNRTSWVAAGFNNNLGFLNLDAWLYSSKQDTPVSVDIALWYRDLVIAIAKAGPPETVKDELILNIQVVQTEEYVRYTVIEVIFSLYLFYDEYLKTLGIKASVEFPIPLYCKDDFERFINIYNTRRNSR